MSGSVSTISSGITFPQILTLVFIVLKLTHYIHWSWWWVLSPVWIPIVLIFGIIFLLVAFGGRN